MEVLDRPRGEPAIFPEERVEPGKGVGPESPTTHGGSHQHPCADSHGQDGSADYPPPRRHQGRCGEDEPGRDRKSPPRRDEDLAEPRKDDTEQDAHGCSAHDDQQRRIDEGAQQLTSELGVLLRLVLQPLERRCHIATLLPGPHHADHESIEPFGMAGHRVRQRDALVHAIGDRLEDPAAVRLDERGGFGQRFRYAQAHAEQRAKRPDELETLIGSLCAGEEGPGPWPDFLHWPRRAVPGRPVHGEVCRASRPLVEAARAPRTPRRCCKESEAWAKAALHDMGHGESITGALDRDSTDLSEAAPFCPVPIGTDAAEARTCWEASSGRLFEELLGATMVRDQDQRPRVATESWFANHCWWSAEPVGHNEHCVIDEFALSVRARQGRRASLRGSDRAINPDPGLGPRSELEQPVCRARRDRRA